jgi:hypothetical protein
MLREIPQLWQSDNDLERFWSEQLQATKDELRANELPAYRIFLSDGTDYVTSMAHGVTLEDARSYFNRPFYLENENGETFSLSVVNVEQA